MPLPAVVSPDLRVFLARLSQEQPPQEHLTRVGLRLVDGALRVRCGGNGVYEAVERPVTKPAEAIGEWLRSIEKSTVVGGEERSREAREAVVAAAEELDRAAYQTPSAGRLRAALYSDALDTLAAEDAKPVATSTFWPWTIAAVLSGIILGMLVGRSFK